MTSANGRPLGRLNPGPDDNRFPLSAVLLKREGNNR